jgi:predicted enzyme related to lactoylglutathione lyase
MRCFLAIALAIAALTQQTPVAQARASAQAGEFVWHDLITDDAAASRAFYGALFGWTFTDGRGIDPGYVIIKDKDRPIGGIVTIQRPKPDTEIAQWLAYVVVPDVDAATAAFREAGGRVLRGPLNARSDLRVAVVVDGQGAPIGLASRGQKLPPDIPPAVNRWLWMEYVASDADAALSFYTRTVGFTSEVRETRPDFTYHLLKTDRPRAGLFKTPWPRETSAWLPYVRVDDPAAMAEKVKQLGGSVLLPPDPSIRNGSLAIVFDPTGAPLALQKFPFTSTVTP